MPSSLLFGINTEGRVFGLSTNGTKWREFVYLGLEFKQLSAIPNALWALGGDRQIYVHVHGLDIPIRIKEVAFENERWTPMHGFSSRLLPTDRYHYSSEDGTQDRGLKKIRLPSMAWQWEGDWRLELNLAGQPLDHDGWTYAVDFPATFHASKQWTSCVRRRKWVRYRRYSALNSWCAIAPLHKDATQEPFIGVAVGGQDAGFTGGRFAVWAVTAHGRLMFRTEVSSTSPEGQRWCPVVVPTGCEVLQITVGTSGLVWCVLQNGKAFVRLGVTRDSIMGTGWTEVAPPDGQQLIQVSLGSNALWAVTREQHVWFRSGVQMAAAGVSEDMARGSNWVDMMSKMASVSVAPNDQVFAVGAVDRLLYFRTGVSAETLTGKTWRQVGAPTQMSRTGSVASLFSGAGSVANRDKRHRSWNSLNRYSGSHDSSRLELDFDGNCHSAPTLTRHMPSGPQAVPSSLQPHGGPSSFGRASISSAGSSSSSGVPDSLPEEAEHGVPEIHEARPRVTEQSDTYENTSHPVVGFNSTREILIKKRSRAWSPTRSCGSIVGVEAHSEADSSVFEADVTAVYGEVGEREDDDDHLYWTDSEALWTMVEAGACQVHPAQLPNWFADPTVARKAELERPWRLQILEELRGRVPGIVTEEQNYEPAVDTTSWSKTADLKCLVGDAWTEASLTLEWVEGDTGADFGTLTVSCPTLATTLMQCSIADLNAAIRCSEPSTPRIALHRPQLAPIKLQFAGEDELEDWLGELNELLSRVRQMPKSPGPDTLWITTMLGDVHGCDFSDLVEQKESNGSIYTLEISLIGQTTPIDVPLHNGLKPKSSITVHGCVPDKADRFALNLVSGENAAGDIIFHLNPRFADGCVVRNARRNGVWGPEDRRGAMPFQIGQPFVITVACQTDCVQVSVDGNIFTEFKFRNTGDGDTLTADAISHLNFAADISVTKVVYSCPTPILSPASFFFRHIGGNLRKVASAGGVTWGIGYDNTAWVYTGGTGGPYIKGTDASKNMPMTDAHTFFVYENQRWNPLTGYTPHGLPTDRHMWSDVTGRHRRTMDKTKLPSKRWQWESEWAIDFSTPGGTDKDGWQYAVDFPASYHGKKHLTDYVRRRRWRRRAKLVTYGPWLELGHSPLVDCCLHVEADGAVIGWGTAINGDVLFRTGLSVACPGGIAWEHVACDEPIANVSSAPMELWGVARLGCAYRRFDITQYNLIGTTWETVDSPKGATLKQISVGPSGVWVLDTSGRLSVRKEISEVFPSGSHWQTLPLDGSPAAQPDGEAGGQLATPLSVPGAGFRHITSGIRLWAINASGVLMFRLSTTHRTPAGTAWIPCLDAGLCHSASS